MDLDQDNGVRVGPETPGRLTWRFGRPGSGKADESAQWNRTTTSS